MKLPYLSHTKTTLDISDKDFLGMSLRDYFAGQAMVVLLNLDEWESSRITELSYKLADVMLKERGK